MGPKKYIVTVTNGEDRRVFMAKEGERLMMKDRSFIVVGVTPSDSLPNNVRIESLTKDNKYKIKTKKLTNK